MSEDKIKIKGENGGLMLEFPSDMNFSEIMEELAGRSLGESLIRVRGSSCVEHWCAFRGIAFRKKNLPKCRNSFGRTG